MATWEAETCCWALRNELTSITPKCTCWLFNIFYTEIMSFKKKSLLFIQLTYIRLGYLKIFERWKSNFAFKIFIASSTLPPGAAPLLPPPTLRLWCYMQKCKSVSEFNYFGYRTNSHCEFLSVGGAVGERISVFISVVTSRSSSWKRCVITISDMERAYGFGFRVAVDLAALNHCARSAHKVFPLVWYFHAFVTYVAWSRF